MLTISLNRAALVLATGLALAACKPAPPSVPEATGAAPSATPAAPANPAATPAATPPAVAVPKVSHTPTGAAPVEGKDYVAIPGGQPLEAQPGQVEVAEVFNYVCPACAAFEPMFGPWAKSLPASVHVTHVPAQFGGADSAWTDYARAYYAAEAMGAADRTHQALYDEIHVKEALKGERGRDGIDAIAAFYGRQGLDGAQFKSTAQSFAVEGKLARAKQFAQKSGIEGTPTLIIDGKYRITGGETRQDQLRIADHLIANELGNKK